MRTILKAAIAASLALPAIPAAADPPPWAPAHGWRDKQRHDSRGHYNQRYDSRGYYSEPRRLSRNDRVWRGDDGRYYCRRDNGTTGLVVGAAIGGLIGNRIAGRGDRTLGTIIGAVGGGLLGREVDRGGVRCR